MKLLTFLMMGLKVLMAVTIIHLVFKLSPIHGLVLGLSVIGYELLNIYLSKLLIKEQYKYLNTLGTQLTNSQESSKIEELLDEINYNTKGNA